MRTAAAYISKLKAEALGRTYKVQDTNHRLFTSTLYRGAAGCGPVNYDQIEYVETCKCDYIGPAKKYTPPSLRTAIYDGGNASSNFPNILNDDGLSNIILDSGNADYPYPEPVLNGKMYDGGNTRNYMGRTVDGGVVHDSAPLLDGGFP